jgi:hypothetical protein
MIVLKQIDDYYLCLKKPAYAAYAPDSQRYFSEITENLTDLKTICRDCACDPAWPVNQTFSSRAHDIIVIENETDKLGDARIFFEDASRLLREDGQLITTAVAARFPIITEALRRKGLAVDGSVGDYYYSFTRMSDQSQTEKIFDSFPSFRRQVVQSGHSNPDHMIAVTL